MKWLLKLYLHKAINRLNYEEISLEANQNYIENVNELWQETRQKKEALKILLNILSSNTKRRKDGKSS